ncbi:hypothetical protein Fmac_025620 [Flemingia macrophylla]|uniref:pectinesterase n=1 Tax=Flemingia macrophylla TaxID=520843 RepID=A0ABD1LSR4_9FABA
MRLRELSKKRKRNEEAKEKKRKCAPNTSFNIDEIPANKEQVESWFKTYVGPLNTRDKTLDPTLVTAEKAAKIIKVMQDGSGEFDTINDDIKSVLIGNTKRVILYIGSGNYKEKIKIEKDKPFISLYGEPKNMPNLTFGGTTQQYGTVDSKHSPLSVTKN